MLTVPEIRRGFAVPLALTSVAEIHEVSQSRARDGPAEAIILTG